MHSTAAQILISFLFLILNNFPVSKIIVDLIFFPPEITPYFIGGTKIDFCCFFKKFNKYLSTIFAFFFSLFGSMTKDTDAINYLKFSWGSGNIASGEFTLYGRKIT